MSTTATHHPPSAKPPPTGPPPRPNGNIPATGAAAGRAPPPQRKNPNAGNPNIKVEPSAPPDPMTMYESLKNRIAALEEEEVTVEEEERRLGASPLAHLLVVLANWGVGSRGSPPHGTRHGRLGDPDEIHRTRQYR